MLNPWYWSVFKIRVSQFEGFICKTYTFLSVFLTENLKFEGRERDLGSPPHLLRAEIHESAVRHAARLALETKHESIITPKFYVELILLYKSMLVEQKQRVTKKLARLRGGLEKLYNCNDVVNEMEKKLKKTPGWTFRAI